MDGTAQHGDAVSLLGTAGGGTREHRLSVSAVSANKIQATHR